MLVDAASMMDAVYYLPNVQTSESGGDLIPHSVVCKWFGIVRQWLRMPTPVIKTLSPARRLLRSRIMEMMIVKGQYNRKTCVRGL
eukprot:53511-Eustigmatos_ZCMA.PRE.1